MADKVVGELSWLDRFLTVWIFLAMVVGIGAGAALPELAIIIDMFRIQEISLPIAIGLIWMMYPPLARVKYGELPRVVRNWRVFGISLIQNWIIGPVLMTILAWVFLSDLPEYMIGVIIIGMARCIAMVLVWNHLAHGDHEYCAALVALNSIFQILLYVAYIYFFGIVLTSKVGMLTGISTLSISMWQVAATVLVFLGIPFFAGMITRFSLTRRMGEKRYEQVFLHKIHPTTLIGLLFTIVVLFSLRAESVLILPWHVLRIALPLLLYFSLMFMVSFFMSKALGFVYAQTASLSFTAASNNFELAIATAVGLFGLSSGQAFATVVGPLIEVPVMISLVNFALWARRRLFTEEGIPIRVVKSKSQNPGKGAQILFICVENSCRSQMSEAILNKLAEDRGIAVRAMSAGTRPAAKVNPLAVQALREIAIDASHQKPKLLTQEMLEKAERVITMGCLARDVCPAIFLPKTEDWRIEDPSGKPVEKFREVRDVIKGKVEGLLSNLLKVMLGR